MLLSALKNAEIDKRSPLTGGEEADAVVKKEIKQTKETLELAPADRADIREEAQARLAVYQEFAPEDLTEEQIAEVIKSVLAELGIENPAPSDKGKIMKTLMPKVKGQGRRKGSEPGTGWNSVQIITKGKNEAEDLCIKRKSSSISRRTSRRC